MMMNQSRRNAYAIIILVLTCCLVMVWVEGSLRPIYPVKSALKIAVFLGCTGLYALLTKDKGLLGGYLLLSPWLDLSAIPANLAAKEGITAKTFPLAALYITFCNSLLEEFFFRGFAFLALYRLGYTRLAYGFSALAFALYHVSITSNWGTPGLIVLMVAGLTAAGLFFNWLDRDGSVLPSWLVHVGANLGTNAVGFILFGIL